MKTFLCILWLSLCLLKLSSSSPAGISPREDKTHITGVFNISGFLSLQSKKNLTLALPVNVRISGSINLIISPTEALDSSKHIADWDDALIKEREPVFRKDYFLDETKRGWFKLHRVPEQWENARQRCELEGAELASPLDEFIHQAMKSKIVRFNGVFTGIHSIFSYGDYYSLKGVPLIEMPVQWADDLSSDKNERCVKLLSYGTITNVKCNLMLPYICYKKNDYTPITPCGTIDTEYTLNDQLQTCYKFHMEKKNWSDAFKTCSAEGGHLTVINSDAEMAAVIQLFNKDINGKDLQYKVFVGITSRESGQWVTIHDEKLEKSGFSTWGPNEQSNIYYGVGSCGALGRSGLAGITCEGAMTFVCEKAPDSLITMYQLNEITNPIDI